jgi:NADPH-dependent 7-cyano-7-deazaguanine reductase QueF-like protein
VHPSEIAKQIAELTAENNKGAEALYQAEVDLAQKELELDTIEQKAFIKAQGTVADRTAISRLEASEARLERDLARAKVNRIKVKIKALETALMAAGTQAKLMQMDINL